MYLDRPLVTREPIDFNKTRLMTRDEMFAPIDPFESEALAPDHTLTQAQFDEHFLSSGVGSDMCDEEHGTEE